MIPVNSETMRNMAPHFSGENGERQARIIAAIGAVLATTLEGYGITSVLRIAHFLGQTCHESAGFRTTEEFASGDAYENRADLGNVNSGDGPRFKGRGLLQLTGRANYRTYGTALGVDLEGNPAQAAEPVLSLRIACEYWKRRNINNACDLDDIVAVTRLVNGGTNGLEQRTALTAKAKMVVAALAGVQLPDAPSDTETRPVLRRGSQGDDVTRLQSLLRNVNLAVEVDGDFGADTEAAVTRFQSSHNLTVDGIVGAQTWATLEAAAETNS